MKYLFTDNRHACEGTTAWTQEVEQWREQSPRHPANVGCSARTRENEIGLARLACAQRILHISRHTRAATPPFHALIAHAMALLVIAALLPGCANTVTPRRDPFNITEQADKAYQRGDWLVAEKYYKDLTRRVPTDAYGWTRLGNIRLRQNKFEGAVHAYRAAIERDPEAPRAHYNLATAHLLLARDALQKAQQYLPMNDNGAKLIKKKLGHFDDLIYEPVVEVTSPNKGLIRQRETKAAAFDQQRYPRIGR